jgi:hypothetical protein
MAKVFAQTAQMDLFELDEGSRRSIGAARYDCKLNSANSRRYFTGHNSKPGY